MEARRARTATSLCGLEIRAATALWPFGSGTVEAVETEEGGVEVPFWKVCGGFGLVLLLPLPKSRESMMSEGLSVCLVGSGVKLRVFLGRRRG